MDIAGLRRKAPAMPSRPSPQAALGLAVKERREELGQTQERLALNTGIHARWISNVENAKRNPSYASLRRLAAGLDVPVSELIRRAEQIEGDVAKSNRRASATARS